jgi:hypothetical protein
MSEVIYLSHNGLGDNITSISAINYLLIYYQKVYFLCKDIHEENCKKIYSNLNVECLSFDSKNEFSNCYNIISNFNKNKKIDIIICGCHKKYLRSKITNVNLLNYKQNDEKYTIEYSFIRNFYWDSHLDLKVYYEHFDIKSSYKSIELYSLVKKYNIYFTHTQASNCKIDISNYTNEYLFNDNWIIICANENIYDITSEKYELANLFINIPIAYYIDIIKNATNICVINSCFSCIIYPLKKVNKISKNVIIINR